MKKSLKFVFAIFILISIIWMVPMPSLAEGGTGGNFDFTRYGESNPDINTPTKKIMGTAINVIRIVGTAIAILALTYIGMRYMMASAEQKAEFKKSAYIYIVGAIMVFAASNILGIVYKFAENI